MSGSRDLPLEAYLTALCSLDDLGPGRLRWMLRLGSPEEVWARVRAGKLPVPPPRVAPATIRAAWATQATGIEPARGWERCERLGVGVVALGGAGYPPALADDVDPPVVLFHLGDPDRIASPRVGIVGTRRATGYGLQVAREFGRELAAAGASVVSGLALGIDAAAHEGSLADAGAAPVAVVAAGLDAPCPRRNRPLAGRVADAGVVFSEVPPGISAAPWRFPVRNRVIAALSDVVVVVESPGAGGSMVTVREAMDRDRTVLSVPGPIHSRASEGTNRLIGDGALIAAGVDDVLMALGLDAERAPRASAAPAPRAPAEVRELPVGDAAAVLEAIGWRPASVEQLALRCGLDFRGISRAVAELESAGWIQRTDGWIERIARG